jgi:hypothetical protein
MTTSFKLEHDFPDIPVELFERYLNHDELIAMLAGMPAFRSRDLVEKKDLGDGRVNWRFKVVAGGDIPASARKVVSEDMLTWHEDTRFEPKEHTIHWSIVPLKEKVRDILEAHGIWKLIPSGKGTRRVIEGHITVKITLVGKVVEQFIATELKKNYDVEPDIQRKFYRMMRDREQSKPSA